MRQCVFVLGTRAQLVKVAPVLNQAMESGLSHAVWFTGQHDESIDDLVEDFEISSEFVMPIARQERSSILRLLRWMPGTLISCTRYLRGIHRRSGKPPVVVVHGDTLSTLLGALAARFAGTRVVHLESGLSSGKLLDPFPEELLRRATFRLCNLALCPNDEASERMRKMGHCEVVHTGENTLLDCVRFAVKEGQLRTSTPENEYFVASIHRFQNIYSRQVLEKIVDELISLSALAPVWFILHPPTEGRLIKYGLYERLREACKIHLEPRMPYSEFLALIAAARGVISDGGSNQEELSYLGIPTVLLRDRSERPDGIGRNIVFYDDVAPLSDFVADGRLDALRQPLNLDESLQPSRITVESLQAISD